ncbi:YraN family protein [bacterium SCSIO 12643]|nr:YraN family protein [bacterium SCSIO 12643]
MASHNELGKAGEKVVQEYLVANGYSILELNYRFGRDEIDIIAQENEFIVFIEVKTRATCFFETPEQAVNLQKQKRIIRVANQYLIENDLDNEARFDIFGVTINHSEQSINHIKSAFVPRW